MTTITIQPWPDKVIDVIGHDPRSHYVEKFWLPTLGPTSLLLLRHLATRFDQSPEGIEIRLASTSQALGVGAREGASSPLVRSLTRLAQFDLACDDGRGTVAVRRNVPPVNRRHLKRLPADLRAELAQWNEVGDDNATLASARKRARRVAFTLLEQGDDPGRVERVLFSTGFHPSICHDAAQWAYERHTEAQAEADAADAATAPDTLGVPDAAA
ncbi:MAG: hypothetical protein R3A49_14425 [Acidimicrobiia bacterium]